MTVKVKTPYRYYNIIILAKLHEKFRKTCDNKSERWKLKANIPPPPRSYLSRILRVEWMFKQKSFERRGV